MHKLKHYLKEIKLFLIYCFKEDEVDKKHYSKYSKYEDDYF